MKRKLWCYRSIANKERFFVVQFRNASGNEEDGFSCSPVNLSERNRDYRFNNDGLSSKVLLTLFLSIHTVNTHRKNISKKLNVKSRAR